jgi:hypothetical protein
MGKSDIKLVVSEFCSGVFTEDENKKHPVVVHDMVCNLRSYGFMMKANKSPDKMFGIDDIVRYLFTPVVALMHDTVCYVALFDKARRVTTAKQPEQSKRDSASIQSAKDKQTIGTVWSTLNRINMQDSSAASGDSVSDPMGKIRFPANVWGTAINGRTSRNATIRALGFRASKLLPKMLRDAKVPSSHTIIVDFEGFASEDDQLPLVITSDGVDVDRSSTFRNTLGEFDVSALYYVHHPTMPALLKEHGSEQPTLLIRSIDTDMIPIMMLNTGPEHPGAPAVLVESTLTQPRRKVLMNPLVLRAWIMEYLDQVNPDDKDEVSRVDQQVCDFVRMYILAGSDFCRGPPGVSCRTLMLKYIDCRGRLSPDRIVRDATEPSGMGPVLFSASKRTRDIEDRRRQYSSKENIARSKWCLNYWQHSVVGADTHLFGTPIGHGFSPNGTEMMYTEDMLQERKFDTSSAELDQKRQRV